MSIKHEHKLSIETINQALSMHGLIATIIEQLVKGKNLQEFNSNNKTSKRVVLDPQEKTTLETLPSINQQNENEFKGQKQKMKLQFETENEI